MSLILWVGLGALLAIAGFLLLTRSSRGSDEVMERLASSPDRPAAFGRPSASVWDQESRASREGLETKPEGEDPPHRKKGER